MSHHADNAQRSPGDQVRHDILNRDDVKRLVVEFYTSAFADPLIGPLFTDVAKMDLDAHLPIMCDFWESVLFNARLYRRNALKPHVILNSMRELTPDDFAQWLTLWRRAVDANFSGPTADHAKIQAGQIALSIQRRLSGGTGSSFETIERRPSDSA